MGRMAETVFQFLFKYRPVVFDRGDLEFGSGLPNYALVPLILTAVTLIVLGYLRVRGRLRGFDRGVLLALRLGVLAIVLFCLSRPMLVLATVVPQENFLGILVDDSRSMQIGDGGTPRSDFVRDQLGPNGKLLADLAERFKLRMFGFSDGVARLSSVERLSFVGSHTLLGEALSGVQEELSAVPLAGIVVVSDGADNSGRPLTDVILQLRGSGVPVHTVGVGRERYDRDIELSRVESPREVLRGASVVVEVVVVQSGYRGKTVTLNVEDAGRIISTQDVTLMGDGEITTARAYFTASEPGPRLYRFHIVPEPDELVLENNTREVLIEVRDRREKILYFEGEPRFEVKFIRRAIADDDNIRIVTLQRTAENKFYRLDIDNEDELAAGFPRTREELFQYRALILGSVEASFFTHDQLEMITEFVGQRGGGLLVLGGRHSFAEGGYAGTPVASVLPVVLPQPDQNDSLASFREVRVELTPLGRTHPITQLDDDPQESARRWSGMPAVSTLNSISEVAPGASTLLRGRTAEGDGVVVLAAQRYGRGRVLALPIQDSWMWQMSADVPLDDDTHERFWQQQLRWLVQSVPDIVTVVAPDHSGVGEDVEITAVIVDSAYLKVNDATVSARVTAPSGVITDVPAEWAVESDGEYRAKFSVHEVGIYEVETNAERGGRPAGSARTHVLVADPTDEFFGAQMRSALLQRLAQETGGRFYTPETVAALPEDVRYTESGSTVYEELDIWDMPIVFLLLIGMLAGEWGLRRARGLI